MGLKDVFKRLGRSIKSGVKMMGRPIHKGIEAIRHASRNAKKIPVVGEKLHNAGQRLADQASSTASNVSARYGQVMNNVSGM